MTWRLYVNAVGFAAPGVDNATALCAQLNGERLGEIANWAPKPTSLSRRQTARLSEAAQISIMAAEQIARAVPEEGAWVFASSTGEGWTLNEILKSLASEDIMIQPLRFQNAVHNTAQGQWSIAAQRRSAGTSIASFDNTLGAGLLKSLLQITVEGRAVGFVTFDAPLPPPLHDKRRFEYSAAAALALSPNRLSDSIAALSITYRSTGSPTDPGLASAVEHLLSSGNPVRFALPLFKEIFDPTGSPVILSLTGGSVLEVVVEGLADAL